MFFCVFNKVYEGVLQLCTIKGLKMGTEYVVRVHGRVGNKEWGEWCSVLNFETKKWMCSWRQCPKTVEDKRKYFVSGDLNSIATKSEIPKVPLAPKSWSGSIVIPDNDSFVIGDTPIPIGTIVSWKVECSKYDSNVGITTTDGSYTAHIDCSDWFICSGSNRYNMFSELSLNGHNLDIKKHFYIVCVVVDTEKRMVSFVVDGVIFGTVPNIPLDKPLVPLVILKRGGDKAELTMQ